MHCEHTINAFELYAFELDTFELYTFELDTLHHFTNLEYSGKEPKMNMTKRTLLTMILLTMVLQIALSGCAGSGGRGKSLYEHGLDVVALMDEMVNSSYGSLLSDAADIEKMRQTLAAGDYTAPQAVYEMEIPTVGDMFAYAEVDAVTASFSDSLKKLLDNRSAASLVTLINSQSGAAALAASSVYTAAKTFVSSETEEGILYLYTFQDGNPIAVVFTTGEDGTVTATGTFLMAEGFDAASAEQLQALFREAGFPGAMRLLPDAP